MVLFKEVIGFGCPSVCEWCPCCDVLVVDLLLGWKVIFQVILGVVMSWAVVVLVDILWLVEGVCFEVSRVFGEVGAIVLCDSCGSSWVFLAACERSLVPS